MVEQNLVGFSETSISGLLTRPLKIIPDSRGSFIKLFLNSTFVEDNISISYRNVLRGIHYETETCRMFTPIHGRLYVVFLDLQDKSETKNDWFSVTIDDSNRHTFLIPPYVGCAYLVLSDIAVVHYKWEHQYDEYKQRGVPFDSEFYNIYWPGNHSNFILSERDFYCK